MTFNFALNLFTWAESLWLLVYRFEGCKASNQLHFHFSWGGIKVPLDVFFFFWHKLKTNSIVKEMYMSPWENQRKTEGTQEIIARWGLTFQVTNKLLRVTIRLLTPLGVITLGGFTLILCRWVRCVGELGFCQSSNIIHCIVLSLWG